MAVKVILAIITFGIASLTFVMGIAVGMAAMEKSIMDNESDSERSSL